MLVQFFFYLFSINIHNYPTLPSLAFAIFRSKYLKLNVYIPKIIGDILLDIKQSFYGGHTDMYIPDPKGKKI